MPLISAEAMFKTIAEQQAQIKELQEQVAQLELMLEHQNQATLAQELVNMLDEYPETLHAPIIASIDVH